MSNTGFNKCYFLSPTRNNPPEGLIQLGNVIPSPSLPDEAFARPIAIELPMEVRQHNEYNWSYTYGQNATHGFGVWASFLEQVIGASGKAGVEWLKGNNYAFTCTSISTLEFSPSKEYLKKTIEDTEVNECLQASRFWLTDARVYMITGIKIAHGASMVASFAKKWDLNLHSMVDTTPAGIPAQAGAGTQHGAERQEQETFSKADDFVIGYRLRRLKVTAKGVIKENAQYNKGTAFRKDEGTDEQEKITFDVAGLEDQDARGADFDMMELLGVDEDGQQPCKFVKTE